MRIYLHSNLRSFPHWPWLALLILLVSLNLAPTWHALVLTVAGERAEGVVKATRWERGAGVGVGRSRPYTYFSYTDADGRSRSARTRGSSFLLSVDNGENVPVLVRGDRADIGRVSHLWGGVMTLWLIAYFVSLPIRHWVRDNVQISR